MSHPIPFLCTRYEDTVSRAVQKMKPLAGKQIFCSEFIALELWTSQPCSATAEDPESCPVSRSCIYHSVSALHASIASTFSVRMAGYVLIYALFHLLPSLFSLNSDFRMFFVSAQSEIHKYIFCYAVLMTFFYRKKNICCLWASVTSGISLVKDILCLVIQKFL